MVWWFQRAPQDGVDCDLDDVRYYLIVNGERARSKRTKERYGYILSIRRSAENQNFLQLIFTDNRGATANVREMRTTEEFVTREAEAIINKFTALTQPITVVPDSEPLDDTDTQFDSTLSDLSDTEETQIGRTQPDYTQPSCTRPLMTSTPMTQKRSKSDASKKKRVRRSSESSSDSNKENSFSVETKSKGVYSVDINNLVRAPEGFLTREYTEDQIKHVKAVLRDTRPTQLPVIPVMTTSPWTGRVTAEDQLIVLGGYPLYMAAKDLSEDPKFRIYSQLDVRVFNNVERTEVYEVEALYGIQSSLLQDGDSLKNRVASFREMLYRTAGESDLKKEPPKPSIKTSARWRRMCAASIGKSTERCAMKALEPTFQLAQYSSRCYEKVCRIFQIQQEHDKEVKQAFFVPLQGLGEEERYMLLSQVVSGEIALKELKALAEKSKKLQGVKAEMVAQLGCSTWEETVNTYPLHTSHDFLKPYNGMDFKKSIPRSFLQLVQAAKTWRTNGGQDSAGQNLQFMRAPEDVPQTRIALAFVDVKQDSDLTAIEALATRTTVAYICKDVIAAGYIVKKLNGKEHSYSVLLNTKDDKVQHLVLTTWRVDGIEEHPPKMETILSGDYYLTILDRFSQEEEIVLIHGQIPDAVVTAATMKRKVVAVVSTETEERVRMALQQISDDPYEYSE